MSGLLVSKQFFENLKGIPEEEKTFVIKRRKSLRKAFKAIEEQNSIKTNVPEEQMGEESTDGAAVEAQVEAFGVEVAEEPEEPVKKKRKPRNPPPIHLRCVATIRPKRKNDDPEQCKRKNKLEKGSTALTALGEWSEDGDPSELLFCKPHNLEDNNIMPGTRDEIQAQADAELESESV